MTSLGRSGELGLEGLHVEGGLAVVAKDGLIELGEGEGGNSHLTLLGVGQENVPLGGVIAGEVRSVGERRQNRLVVNRDRLAVGTLNSLLLAAKVGLKVVFGGVNVFQVQLVDLGHIFAARGDNAALDDKGNQRGGDDESLAGNLEEGLGNAELGQLLSDINGRLVLGLSKEVVADHQVSAKLVGQIHKLLKGNVNLGVASLDLANNVLGKVRELKERRGLGRESLDEVLAGRVCG